MGFDERLDLEKREEITKGGLKMSRGLEKENSCIAFRGLGGTGNPQGSVMLRVCDSSKRLGPAGSKSPISKTFLWLSKATLGFLTAAVKKLNTYHLSYHPCQQDGHR